MSIRYIPGISKAVSVSLFLLLSACTFTPAELALKPNVIVPSSDIGGDTKVSFKFVDERDDVTVGHRGVATIGAKISSSDLPTIIESNLRDMLAKKHFILVSQDQPKAGELIYRLRSFKFDIESGFFTGGRNASAALAVDARRNDKTYENVYRYNSEERIVFVPGESEINQQMNAALNQILSKAAIDTELDHFLTGR